MSEWRERANRRRDERHTIGDIRPPASTKKNTKKWCKGKVGREHKPQCRSDPRYPASWRHLVCTECGKQLDWYYPSTFERKREPKPAWVVD